ncbi:uncharacterized protein si:ch1073-456m8.1 isoform X2 [Pimephales promelas]|uniref:uncharacterized protein si:ch1073-456m8.1 isoform X2 n=1 Tax=Pimephales promelas TaxID=90988 RepID=UPI00195551C3|nr:uncharacterized protein si:ch1073-456m8.1 isoform X2 [Pimephales promelas]KAG1934387.1 hypothetical protein F2P79_019978 [Pimephales promelas]
MSRSLAHRSHPTTQHNTHCPSGRETPQKHTFLGPVVRGNMHSGQLEKAGSLRKRTLSRGMSEEESLRHIIREAEESSRHLSRSDSRYGSLKRGAREESQSEDDLLSENVEMEECVRTLSLQQEALLFQVEVLQDALEGAEEMLAETQRETHQLTLELERERAMRRKMEDKLASVTQEMERLREERTVEQTCRPAPEGSSVDRDETPLPASGGAPVHRNTPVLHLKNIIRQSLGLPVCEDHQTPEVCEDHQTPEVCEDVETPEAQDENEESSGYEDAPSEFSPTADSPDVPDVPDIPDEEHDGNIPARNRTNDDSCTLS